MMKWCDHCRGDVEANIVERNATYEFKGETFEIIETVAVCPSCKEELTDELLDNQIMQQLTDLYMKRKGLSFEDIKDVRNQYGFSMEIFAKILNWSKATVVRYESGKFIPDSSHMAILKLLKDRPEEIEEFYKLNKHKFTEKEQIKIENQLKRIDTNYIEKGLFDILRLNYHIHDNTIESGYSQFSLEKLIQMILFFSQGGIQKTKLMKLLFYSDFLNYKRDLLSLSGLPYLKYPHGPVPKDYELILSTLEKAGYIEIQEEYKDDYTYITIKALKNFQEDFFDDQEIKVLHFVRDYFKNFGSVSISKFSHEEEGWKQTELKNIIPYQYAETLQLD
ncbi:type II TA system antitoxin MqsA family protein [Bacillus methanolicus]|uniref:type II TA system antitoxin MqsA family protein n=1 Tax=Bacillus methanolicus TaxID=1471 RepID=UPI0023801240|nr:type II TA system antitoxin MqsA family protein [Bacillus methanolicus]